MRWKLLAALLLAAGTLRAQTDPNLERRLMELERRVRDQDQTILEQQNKIDRLLERDGEADPARIDAAVERYLDRKHEEGELFELSDLSLEGVWKDGFKLTTRDERHQLQVGGRLQFDGIFNLGEDDPFVSTFRNRRIRLFASGYLFDYYHYKVQVDFASGQGVLQDGWLDIRYIDEAQLQVGQFKEPFGLEELTSSKYVKLVERSLPTNFIAPGHDLGAMLHGKLFDGKLEYFLGLFNGNGSNRLDNNDEEDFAARLVVHPFKDSDNKWIKGFQFGAATTYGKEELGLAGGGPRTAARTRIWTYRAGTVTEEERIRWAVEAAWHAGPFGFSGEYMEMLEDLGNPNAPPGVEGRARIRGWYTTLNYFLTGEDTSFKRVKPKNPFDPFAKDGGPGAWELAARVSQIWTNQEIEPFITGADRAWQFMAGVNWYPNSHLRFSLDYQHAEFGDRLAGQGRNNFEKYEDTIFFRFQIEF